VYDLNSKAYFEIPIFTSATSFFVKKVTGRCCALEKTQAIKKNFITNNRSMVIFSVRFKQNKFRR
jgi:hypothetical protein